MVAVSEGHMPKTPICLIVLGLFVALPVHARPQQESLGDWARQFRAQQEKEPRKAVKVITNDNLPPRPPGGEGITTATGIAETPAGGEKANSTPPSTPPSKGEKSSTGPESSGSKVQTREYWQDKFAAARQALAQAKEEQQLVEDEVNLLQIQQARELDPIAKQGLNDRVQAKQSEVEAKQAATEKTQKALDDLEQEFKESGAPDDWSQTS